MTSADRRRSYRRSHRGLWLRVLSAVVGACAVIALGVMTAAVHEGQSNFSISKAAHIATPTPSGRRAAS